MKKILIVDDDIDFLHLLSLVLEEQFQTYEAAGVSEALKILDAVAVDAICSDFDMKDGTGLDLLKAVVQKGTETPFMLLSGTDDNRIICEAEKYGAQFCDKLDSGMFRKISEMAAGAAKAGDGIGK